MQRYFFNVYDHVDLHDDIGTMLPDQTAVQQHMLKKGAELLQGEPIPSRGWRMEVLDTKGKIVCGMHFGVEAGEQR